MQTVLTRRAMFKFLTRAFWYAVRYRQVGVVIHTDHRISFFNANGK